MRGKVSIEFHILESGCLFVFTIKNNEIVFRYLTLHF